MKLLLALLLVLSSPSQAATVNLILTPSEGHLSKAVQAAPPVPPAWIQGEIEPLFGAAEREGLIEMDSGALASSVRLKAASEEAAEQIRAWIAARFPGWSVQENVHVSVHQSPSDTERFQLLQWGLRNGGQQVYGPEGMTLDRDRTIPIPLIEKQDIGALRIPEGAPGRPKIVVAVLDTGLDHDRDARGERVTGMHPEFIGQVVDKTGAGQECDPTDLAARRSRYTACVARGQPGCITPEMDRDQNGYPLDCLGWNVTATVTTGTPPVTSPAITQDVLGDGDSRDRLGHGSHVAGIIAAAANGIGIRGVITRNVALLPVKVVDRAPNPPRIPQAITLGSDDRCELESPEHDLFAEVRVCPIQDRLEDLLARVRKPRPADPLPIALVAEPTPAPPPEQVDDTPTPGETLLNPERAPIGFVDQIARGMLYAIRSKANIISMSLAWPSDADVELMRRMVRLAQKRGIIVIASAGNDSTEARTSPCQYPGVLCVGAHDPSGALAYFSNFGAAVDIAGPGHNILSTWIRSQKTGRKWTTGPLGYEQKSGTSMAAPFVAGALARLLDLEVSPQEAVARLLTGVRPLRESPIPDPANLHPHVRTGNADLELALQAQPTPVLLPVEKGPIVIEWSPTASSIPLSIPMTNTWAEAHGVVINLALEHRSEPTLLDSSIADPVIQIPLWEAGATKDIQTRIKLPSDANARLKLSGRFFLNLTVSATNLAERVLTLPVELVAPVSREQGFPGARRLNILGDPVPLTADIRTVNARDEGTILEYLTSEVVGERMTLKLYREAPAQIPLEAHFTLAKSITRAAVKDMIVFADVQRVQYRTGKPSGYVLIYQVRAATGNTPSVRFDFYDHELRPDKTLRYDNLLAGLDSERWIWLKATEDGQEVRVPAWVNFGMLPREEFPDVDFERQFYVGLGEADERLTMRALQVKKARPRTPEGLLNGILDEARDTQRDRSMRNRFYFLEPKERKERDRRTGRETGDGKAIARTLGIDPAYTADEFHEYVPLQLIAQTLAERRAGSVRVILARPERDSFGREMRGSLRYAVGVIREGEMKADGTPAWGIREVRSLIGPEQTVNLLGLPDILTMTPLSRQGLRDPRAMYLGQALTRGQYEANLLEEDGDSVPSVTPYLLSLTALAPNGLPRRPDSIVRAAGAYYSPTRAAVFSETQYDLQYDDLTTGERVATTLGRFSFMSQLVFSKLLFPVAVGNLDHTDADLLPGLMIPAQLRSAANMEVIIPDYRSGRLERLFSPARMRLQAGSGCRTLANPTPPTQASPPTIVFLCGDRFYQVPLAY